MTDSDIDPPVYPDDTSVTPCLEESPDGLYSCLLRDGHLGVHRALDGSDRPLGIQWPRQPVERM